MKIHCIKENRIIFSFYAREMTLSNKIVTRSLEQSLLCLGIHSSHKPTFRTCLWNERIPCSMNLVSTFNGRKEFCIPTPNRGNWNHPRWEKTLIHYFSFSQKFLYERLKSGLHARKWEQLSSPSFQNPVVAHMHPHNNANSFHQGSSVNWTSVLGLTPHFRIRVHHTKSSEFT